MIPAMSVSANSTKREVWKGVRHRNASPELEERESRELELSRLLTLRYSTLDSYQSPTNGNSAMNRARLIARATACWLAAWQPVLRRLTIRPWRLVSFVNRSRSL